jgi:hypothetical protein
MMLRLRSARNDSGFAIRIVALMLPNFNSVA